MIICALNQNMLALHFSKILATDDDNKGLNCFHPAFHGKHALVAGEIAIAVVVLFLSTLVMRSFQKLLAVDPGFRIRHRTLAGITRNTVSLCYRCEPTGLGNAIGISGLPKWGRCTQVASSPPGSPASDVCSLRWKQKSHCWSSATAC
jgi:hypothetical protein